MFNDQIFKEEIIKRSRRESGLLFRINLLMTKSTFLPNIIKYMQSRDIGHMAIMRYIY